MMDHWREAVVENERNFRKGPSVLLVGLLFTLESKGNKKSMGSDGRKLLIPIPPSSIP